MDANQAQIEQIHQLEQVAFALRYIRQGAMRLVTFMEELPPEIQLGGTTEDHLTRTLLFAVTTCEAAERANSDRAKLLTQPTKAGD